MIRESAENDKSPKEKVKFKKKTGQESEGRNKKERDKKRERKLVVLPGKLRGYYVA